tara:strand:+ start:10765 stop:11781 length:1017 start_codon:yes stop_codon:yes gene_type:complete
LGYSFYSLQAISLIVDTKIKFNSKIHFNLFGIANYLMFFPQVTAGPIERVKNLLPQFSNFELNSDNIYLGFRKIIYGLFMKLVIADNLLLINQKLTTTEEYFNQFYFVAFTIFNTLHIYYDFYSYTIIAIGIAKVFNIELIQNFNAPYLSSSIKQFWSRWHITLSSWFRDYIYIPLGGNKKGVTIFIISIITTFILSGIWHGQSSNFFIWSGLHILLYLIDHFFLREQTILRRLFFIISINITWIFFSFSNLEELVSYTTICWKQPNLEYIQLSGLEIFILIIIVCFTIIEHLSYYYLNSIIKLSYYKYIDLIIFNLTLLFLILFGVNTSPEFIYFKF